jgi:hypothetical protein
VSTTPPTKPAERRLLVLAAPPPGKLPKDMSDDERRAWAKAIFDAMALAYRAGTDAS